MGDVENDNVLKNLTTELTSTRSQFLSYPMFVKEATEESRDSEYLVILFVTFNF